MDQFPDPNHGPTKVLNHHFCLFEVSKIIFKSPELLAEFVEYWWRKSLRSQSGGHAPNFGSAGWLAEPRAVVDTARCVTRCSGWCRAIGNHVFSHLL